jgi:hypothetical protein
MTETTEEDAPRKRSREQTKQQQTGLILRLGPDSKMSLPIQGSNLLMMGVVAFQLLTTYADIPEKVTTIAEDLVTIKADVGQLRANDTEQAKQIGSLEAKAELQREKAKALADRLSKLETENDELGECIRKPSRCKK